MESLPRIYDFNIILRLETLPLNGFRCVKKQEIWFCTETWNVCDKNQLIALNVTANVENNCSTASKEFRVFLHRYFVFIVYFMMHRFRFSSLIFSMMSTRTADLSTITLNACTMNSLILNLKQEFNSFDFQSNDRYFCINCMSSSYRHRFVCTRMSHITSTCFAAINY